MTGMRLCPSIMGVSVSQRTPILNVRLIPEAEAGAAPQLETTARHWRSVMDSHGMLNVILGMPRSGRDTTKLASARGVVAPELSLQV